MQATIETRWGDEDPFEIEDAELLNTIRLNNITNEGGEGEGLLPEWRLELIKRTQTQMEQNWRRYNEGQAADVLKQWPCQELYRAETRIEPRDWPDRWTSLGGQFYEGEGSGYPGIRMIARKDDPIWTMLGPFGNPFPPFDFNSGMDVRDVSEEEAIMLGVIDPEDNAEIVPNPVELNVKTPVDLVGATEEQVLDLLGEDYYFDGGVLRFDPLRVENRLANAGKPCGDSFIASGDTCHVGEPEESIPFNPKDAGKLSEAEIRKAVVAKHTARRRGEPASEASGYDEKKVTRFQDGLEQSDVKIAGETFIKLVRPTSSTYREEYYVKPGTPPMPLYNTPAYAAWGQEFRYTDSGKKYFAPVKSVEETADEVMAARAKVPAANLKEWDRDALETANAAIFRKQQWDLAEKLGVRRQLYNETGDEWDSYIKSLREDPSGPFGPSGSYAISGYSGARPATHALVDGWMSTGNEQHYWIVHKNILAGESPGKAVERQALVRAKIWSMTTSNPDRGLEYIANAAIGKTEMEGIDRPRPIGEAYIKWAAKYPDLRAKAENFFSKKAEYIKASADLPYLERRDLREAFEKEVGPVANEFGMHAAAAEYAEQLERFVNPNSAVTKAMLALRREAADTLKKPTEVYRGMPIPFKLHETILSEIEKNGHYDLPASELWSWTSREALAKTFARHGQGKKSGRDDGEVGLVVRETATKDNTWMHPAQPTYTSLVERKCASGEKFNSGGCDQKEFILENKTGFIRLTKENTQWI
jgi:hypothetical protein